MAETTISPQFSEAAKGAFRRFHTLELAKEKFAEYVWDSGVKESVGLDFFFEALLDGVGDAAKSVMPKQLKEQAEWWCRAQIFAEGPDWLLSPRFSAWWAEKKDFAIEAAERFPQIAAQAAAKAEAEKAAKRAAHAEALEKVD